MANVFATKTINANEACYKENTKNEKLKDPFRLDQGALK